tara:strand:+ start:7810 stop:7983 length:174 start_codon:yes stop_codon:yes gene_type:complete
MTLFISKISIGGIPKTGGSLSISFLEHEFPKNIPIIRRSVDWYVFYVGVINLILKSE